MKNKFKILLALFILLGSSMISSVNASSSLPVGGTSYTLAGAGVTNSQTTIQLASFATPDGRPITMSMFGTIGYGALDPQTNSKLEDISFSGITQNANGSATLLGVTRGLDFVYPYSATVSLTHGHSGGSTFILTNTAGYYYNEFTMNNNNNLFTWPSASSSPASKGYVDYVAFTGAGAIAATESNNGYVQLATALQQASSTVTGVGPLVLQSKNSTSTYNSATAGLKVVVTKNNGKIDDNFISTTTVLSSGGTFGTSTFTGYVSGTIASSSIYATSSIGTANWTKPYNLRYIRLIVQGAGAGGGAATGGSSGSSQSAGGGGAGGYCERIIPAAALGSTEIMTVGPGGAGGTAGAGSSGGSTTFGSWCTGNGGTGGPAGNAIATGGTGGTATGGDINIPGGSGGPASTVNNMPAGAGGDSTLASGGQAAVAGGGSISSGEPGNQGSGGSGGFDASNSVQANGSKGGDGEIIVYQYF